VVSSLAVGIVTRLDKFEENRKKSVEAEKRLGVNVLEDEGEPKKFTPNPMHVATSWWLLRQNETDHWYESADGSSPRKVWDLPAGGLVVSQWTEVTGEDGEVWYTPFGEVGNETSVWDLPTGGYVMEKITL